MASDVGYYRHPTIFGDTIAFVCEDDLWAVPASGGTARRLTATPGVVSFPTYSPDGSMLAFSGREDGPNEVYVMPADGGTSRRLTWLGTNSQVAGWHPSGDAVLTASDWRQPFRKTLHLLSVPIGGGQPTPIKVGPARAISYNPDGPGIAVGRNSGDPARWKRYRGGTAGTLWVDRKGDGSYSPLIKLEGNLANPMWIGGRIYFLSDHEGYGNVYSVTPTGRGLTRHTNHEDFYVRFPSTDGKRVVYHAGADIWVFDPAEGTTHKVDVGFRSTRSQRNRKFVHGSRYLETADLHPEGHSLAAISRGGLFTMGLWEGAVRRQGEISKIRYRLGRWLPDGKHLIAVHDGSGEESLAIFKVGANTAEREIKGDFGRPTDLMVQPIPPSAQAPKNGKKTSKKASKKTARPAKAAESKYVLVTNQRHELILVNIKTGKSEVIAHTRHGHGVNGAAWSPDGKWIAYGLPTSGRTSSIFLHEVSSGKSTQVTKTDFIDGEPAFDPQGRYLYFISWRTFDPIYDSHYFDLGFPKGAKPYLITLSKETVSPFLAANRSPKAPSSFFSQHREDRPKGSAAREVKIDLDGIQDRVLAFPVHEGRYVKILGGLGRAIFCSFPVEGSLGAHGSDSNLAARGRLEAYDFESNKVERVADGVSDYRLSADHQVLMIRSRNRLRAVASWFRAGNGNQRDEVGRESGWVDMDRIRVAVVPRDEWAQMFTEAWRLQRDQFWTSDMSGIDWEGIFNRYRPLVDRVGSRSEFSDLMWELQGELGTSHCYEMGGDYAPQPNWYQGFLGGDLEYQKKNKKWTVGRIPSGDSWDSGYASPLTSPGLNVKAGDEIVAVGGEPLDAETSPYQCLVHLAGQEVDLTIRSNGQPSKKPTLRNITVKTMRDETPLRYRDWVEHNRARVHKESKGRVGYVHVPDMGPFGYSEFHRYFMMEAEHDGLIVDVRFNGGGHVSQILLEKLLRRRIGYDVNRWGEPESYPSDAPMGPIVALTNEHAGSDGDMFSHAFKLNKIGPLIGKRTWGGVVGIWPRHSLVDGAVTTQPEFAFWFEDVEFGIENYGTDPDIEVEVRPQDYAAGKDPQLERGLSEISKLLKKSPPKLPSFKRPPTKKPRKLPRAKAK